MPKNSAVSPMTELDNSSKTHYMAGISASSLLLAPRGFRPAGFILGTIRLTYQRLGDYVNG